ncbi:hypothetical protein [Paraflavitalea sp. CAU 1676]|uniref:hypothetical protein n=1 Tax=Paraflavitalea sp. CAU 1676 TaxID=3032598 RepID=UPI0023DCAE31|nr:hypothetical protein [Paraflavitalea sp. CAU 1676]MDF2188375.1 hypothetical protein [Paraflavitalea sp. CAU 1676]
MISASATGGEFVFWHLPDVPGWREILLQISILAYTLNRDMKLCKILVPMLICLAYSVSDTFGQRSLQPVANGITTDSINKILTNIRKNYTNINSKLTGLKIVKDEIEGESTEGGSIEKFYDGDSLRKAIVIYYGELGKAILEYYFVRDAELFFVYERRENYDKPISAGKINIAKTEESRYYFNNQQLIRWLTEKVIVNASQYQAKQVEILEDLKRIKRKAI